MPSAVTRGFVPGRPTRQRLVQEVVRVGSQLSALDTAARPVDVANGLRQVPQN